QGRSTLRMPSGAGHDSQNMSRLAPTGMIFIPSTGGRSHSPAEHSTWADIEAGANVLLQAVLSLATEQIAGRSRHRRVRAGHPLPPRRTPRTDDSGQVFLRCAPRGTVKVTNHARIVRLVEHFSVPRHSAPGADRPTRQRKQRTS